MQFDKTELIHLTISVLTITAAFHIILVKAGVQAGLGAVFLTVGVAFLFHELGHKSVAQRFGCTAVYRAWTAGLILALAFAIFTPFIFAAPGAVYIHKKYLTVRENGLISLSGPLTNFLLAFAFLGIIFMFPGLGTIGMLGFQINMFLGMFNMLPFPPLDGYDILSWSKITWIVLFGALVYFTFFFQPGVIF